MRNAIYPIPGGLDIFEEHEVRKMNRQHKLLPIQEKMMKSYSDTKFAIPSNDSIVDASYVSESNDFFLLDAGYKDYIHVPRRTYENEYFKNLKLGDNVMVHIISFTESPFYVEGSISSLRQINARKYLSTLGKSTPIKALIKESTPAGYIVEITVQGLKLDAFMPNTLADVNKLVDPLSIVGKEVDVLIESFSEDEGNYIVNRKAYLNSLIPNKIKELRKDTVYSGFVTGTTAFGVFVQFEDYLTGMIHKSNIHPDWANKLNEIPSGTEIEFYFKYFIKDEKRGDKIILTQIQRNTIWDEIEDGTFKVGDVRKANLIKIIDNDALFSLDTDTMGLADISKVDISTLSKNCTKNVRVIAFDLERHKITLELV